MARLGTNILRRLGLATALGDRLQYEKRERRLGQLLAHEREKVAKLKQRLERLEAQDSARSAESRQLYMALTLERHPPELSGRAAVIWADTAARGRLRAQTRGAGLNRADRQAPPNEGGLFADPPTLRPALSASFAPLRVAIASSATSAFQGCPDPRVVTCLIGDPLAEAADVLVFPRAESRTYLAHAALVPEALWRRVREGQARVVLDGSGEGHRHADEVSRDHHAFLLARGVDSSGVLYLTQDRCYREDYLAWSRAEATSPMRVHVFDAFVGRVLSAFDIAGEQVFKHRLARYLRRPDQRSRRFLSLNYTPRATKLLFLLRLLRDGLWERGWISFGPFAAEGDESGQSRATVIKRMLALEGFEDEAATLLPLIDRLEAMDPPVFMAEKFKIHGKQRARAVQAMDLDQYGDCWFSVVSETEMSARLQRITEKPLKPLMSFHPFLILGSPGSLRLLRSYGFESFSGVLDERYDEEPDPRRRFDMVYDQVRRLCAVDEAELARMSAELSETVVFNAAWGLTELPRRFREQLVTRLVDLLLPPGAPLASPQDAS